MADQGEGRFVAEAPCGHGACYRYRVFTAGEPDGLAVPDPAARSQAGGIEGPSRVIDAERYAWRHPDWTGRPWHETVLYELHLGALGGLEELRRQLPRLAALGITAIELMPVAEFPARATGAMTACCPMPWPMPTASPRRSRRWSTRPTATG
ncbi:hypothetical protein [Halomonas sp. E19]|uniref:hypothetical protein n=1 Tax=Halomonas sp. E19 TaxID=3397247 RepID=UPI00403383A0